MDTSLQVQHDNETIFTRHNVTTEYHFGHSLNATVAAAIATYFILLIIGGVTFNAILIHIIVLRKRIKSSRSSFIEQHHSTTNTFIINLAVCDLLTAISTLPFDADFLFRGHYAAGPFICGLKETFFMFSLPASVVNLLLLTTERFIKLFSPFQHRRFFTKLNVSVIIMASWTYILIIALLPLMMNRNAVTINHGNCYIKLTPPYILYQLIGNFSLPVVVILAMNFILYYHIGKRAAANEKLRRQSQEALAARKRRHGRPTKLSNAVPLNFRAAKTIMTLVGVFLVCWLTFIIYVIVNMTCGVCLPRVVTWIVNCINYSSVALNPVIYGLQNKSIRDTLTNKYLTVHDEMTGSRVSLHNSFRKGIRHSASMRIKSQQNKRDDKNRSVATTSFYKKTGGCFIASKIQRSKSNSPRVQLLDEDHLIESSGFLRRGVKLSSLEPNHVTSMSEVSIYNGQAENGNETMI